MLELRDWETFLGRHDLTWTSKPVVWGEGAPLGNGFMGAMVYYEEHRDKRNVVRVVLGRTDVTAAKPQGGYSPRVPIGELHLELAGNIYSPFEMKLSLWNAELTAEMLTTAGRIRFTMAVHAEKPLLMARLETDPGEREAQWRWYAHEDVHPVMKLVDGYKPDQHIPDTIIRRHSLERGVQLVVQTFQPEETGGVTTAWAIAADRQRPEGQSSLLVLSIANGADDHAIRAAITAVEDGMGQSWEQLAKSHREWWHAYYPQSFVSVPDTLLEGFYWIQMYKLACSTRADGMIIDNQGPWMTASPWPGVWFNMNVQLSYSPVYASNRLSLGESLTEGIRGNMEQLIRNVPEQYRADSAGLGRNSSYDLTSPVDTEVGNLLWICQLLWRHYRYSMERELLETLVYPLLARAVQYHIHLLEEGDDGYLHLPPTISPEYGSFLGLTVPDAHYDLALLEWGCRTLLKAAETMNVAVEQTKLWSRVLGRLAPLPTDDTGYMVGRGQPLEFGHRHFSHLMALYPLRLVDLNDPEARELALRSLRHWLCREGDMRGFTFAGAASMAAALGFGDEAAGCLHALIHLSLPNTMYKEAGPVMESPIAAAEGLHDMLLQSHEGIHVFPAIPSSWNEAVFADLRAEGGFLVSAEWREGRAEWIRLRSLAGEPCRVKADFRGKPMQETVRGVSEVVADSNGWMTLELACGEEAVLFDGDLSGDEDGKNRNAKPVEAQRHLCNYFGKYKPWRRYGLPVGLQQ